MPKERPQGEDKPKTVRWVEEGYNALFVELQAGHTEHFTDYLAFMARFHRYTTANQLLILHQRPEATFVAGRKKWEQWKNPIRQEQYYKGIAIWYPRHTTIENDDGTKVQVSSGFGTSFVYDIAQTQDPSRKPSFYTPLPDDAHERYGRVRQAVEAMGISVTERRIRQSINVSETKGASLGKRIELEVADDSRTKTMTLIHEWAHELMHWGEFARQLPRGTLECQAEAVSFIVSRYLEIENPFSADYLQSWGNNTEELARNMQIVQQTSKTMIELIGKDNSEETE